MTDKIFPPLHEQAAHFVKDHIREGVAILQRKPPTDAEERARRHNICLGCPAGMCHQDRCLLCGCPIAKKTELRSAVCEHQPPFWGGN